MTRGCLELSNWTDKHSTLFNLQSFKSTPGQLGKSSWGALGIKARFD